jgi:PAS domain S-box-containing protein
MSNGLFDWLFDPSGLTPHGFCLLWEPGLIWTYAISDAGIALAYFSIPIALGIFAHRRRDLVFRPIFWLFAAFILLCGATHWLDVVTLWLPAYGVEAVVKAMTAVVSIISAAVLWRLLPHALALPSSQQLVEANAALALSEARYRANFEQSPIPLYTVDKSDIITAVSNSWLALLGYAKETVIGRHISHFRISGSTELDDTQRAHLLREGEIRDQERRFARYDGGVVEALVSARVDNRQGDTSIVCVLNDITARRRAEEALRVTEERLHHSQKMEALGQLTGGIAHDVNNMLQSIAGCLDRMGQLVAKGRTQEIGRYLDIARQAVDRAADLTHRMLAFARRQSLRPRVLDLNELMCNVGELLRRTLQPTIQLDLKPHDGVWSVLCDASQLESALLNLAINARDAMPDGGTLTIATFDRHVPQEDLADQSEAVPGDYVQIAVADTGIGMEKDVAAHAFEPFFTTKPLGQGTGLGLSQVYGFVQQSGGFVRLESQPGRGTTIHLYLPRNQGNPPATEARPGSATVTPHHARTSGKSVLVVDDETEVRGLLVEALHDLGCLVLEAETGPAGLLIIQSTAAIDLLVTDIGLPGLNGRQLADAAVQARPGLPVLMITGYAGTALEKTSLEPGMDLMRKPFGMDEFRRQITELLKV